MRLIFVRHGEPDYVHDCLTDTGRLQAAAAAERLKREGIVKIYSSPLGRAFETAGYTARALGLSVETLPYMREITWGGPDVPENGHPWTLGDVMIDRDDFDFQAKDWRRHPGFRDNAACQCLDMISGRIDGLMLDHGYRREGTRYLCLSGRDETIALFSHGGSGACALSRLLNVPFPYMCSVLPYDFTSIIILDFPVCPGEYIHPRIELFNDTAHIKTAPSAPLFQQTPD